MTKRQQIDYERFLTLNEAAEYLRSSPETVRSLCISGELPARRVHSRGRWLIPRDELYAHLEAQKPENRHQADPLPRGKPKPQLKSSIFDEIRQFGKGKR